MVLKRIVHPQHWLLEKDIKDLETEIEMLERQLPAFKRKLDHLKSVQASYRD